MSSKSSHVNDDIVKDYVYLRYQVQVQKISTIVTVAINMSAKSGTLMRYYEMANYITAQLCWPSTQSDSLDITIGHEIGREGFETSNRECVRLKGMANK